jgi:hypothetical protein
VWTLSAEDAASPAAVTTKEDKEKKTEDAAETKQGMA